MSIVFEQTYHVRWSDVDANRHVRHSVYADLCAATRVDYLNSIGFTMGKFAELRLGPVLFSENINYLSELQLGDEVLVNVQIAGLSKDGRKWKMSHEMYRKADHKLVGNVEVFGAWLDLVVRKIVVPPKVLLSKMNQLEKTKNFENL